MADVLCPVCGKPNPEELESCEFCGTRLKPVSPRSIPVGQEPVQGSVPDPENGRPDADQVRPGEAPTHQNNTDLEKTLPSWLRSLRENKDTEPAADLAGLASDDSLPLSTGLNTSPTLPGDQPDWLTGLGNAGLDNDEPPTWMEGLQGARENSPDSFPAQAAESGSHPPSEPSPEAGGTDQPVWPDDSRWAEGPHASQPGERTGLEELPDWLKSLQAQSEAGENAPAAAPSEAESSDWLDSLISATSKGTPAAQPGETHAESPGLDWLGLAKLPPSETPGSIPPPVPASGQAGGTPDWLAGLPGIPEDTSAQTALPTDNLPDWLREVKGKPSGAEPAAGNRPASPGRMPEPETPPAGTISPGGEVLPAWLSNAEDKTAAEAGKTPDAGAKSLAPSTPSQDEIPDWITRFQPEAGAGTDQGSRPEPSQTATHATAKNEQAEVLPDWLADIRPVEPEQPVGTPDLTGYPAGDESQSPFTLETPDWLAKIIPEQPLEISPQSGNDAAALENPEVSELPSWVQAMRPVESVVAEARPESPEGSGVTEKSGPLAGLSGVLPVGPGIGLISKPPAYSVKLQATESQQRYAAALENLINSESQPQVVKSSRISSNRLWRWLISVLLILAVLLPLVTDLPIAPAPDLKTPELLNAFSVIGSLPANAPVLAVFDYDPALSGEVEAAATPLMDQLLLQGPRLTLLSTSPTGTALAERFLTNSSVSPLIAGHGYQSGQQYVDLGYLAGGPSGIQDFARSPSEASPFTLDGKQAWELPPLQGVQKLSDFAAILVLTDNAETGRAWVEQTGASLGNTPLVMVISAQAEPMLLPYYDAGQIKGLVAGLAGGEAYAQTFVRPDGQGGPAQHYWSSFSTGVLIAEVLIVVGALWYAITRALPGRAGSGEQA